MTLLDLTDMTHIQKVGYLTYTSFDHYWIQSVNRSVPIKYLIDDITLHDNQKSTIDKYNCVVNFIETHLRKE